MSKRPPQDFFKPQPKQSKRELLVCPACGIFTATDPLMISLHLGGGSTGCGSAKLVSPTATAPAPLEKTADYKVMQGAVPGLAIVHDFITEEEEKLILDCLDKDADNDWRPSTFNGKYDMKAYGLRTELRYQVPGGRQVHKAEHPMPDWAGFLHDRLAELPPFIAKFDKKLSGELRNWRANEFNANRYVKSRGHVLEAHFDDRLLSGPILANISMGCDSVMRYESLDANNRQVVDVLLPRRTLQLVAGPSRYNWTHAIPRELIEDNVRTSITMRRAGKKNGVVPSEI
jgi:alkylated DNA repair dioxygenase AlkB